MSQYSRASIFEWLATVSSKNSPPTRTGKKRKREPLVDRVPNTMNVIPRRTPSPTKRRKVDQADLDHDDAIITPRPIHSVDSFGHDDSHQITSSASSSGLMPRSRSPTKQMAALIFAPQPILYEQFMPEDAGKLPAELVSILQSLERCSRGIAVISDDHQAGIAKLKGAGFGAIDQITFTHSSLLPGPSPTPQQCAKAVWLARRCEVSRCCEAAWNSSVHNYVLDLAIHHDEFLDKVYFLNCTSARIEPRSLIPPGQAGTAINAKMVDFVIHVEPSDRFRAAVHARAQLKPTQFSVNHTLHNPLRWGPIGVSIETKHTGQNWDEAMLQVGIWAAAQFTKLEQLATEANELSGKDEAIRELPFLPLIITQGHDWIFLAAVRDPGKQTRLYQKVIFGSTASFLGVYQVITTLQLLARWVRNSYAPWFERTCMNLAEETAT